MNYKLIFLLLSIIIMFTIIIYFVFFYHKNQNNIIPTSNPIPTSSPTTGPTSGPNPPVYQIIKLQDANDQSYIQVDDWDDEMQLFFNFVNDINVATEFFLEKTYNNYILGVKKNNKYLSVSFDGKMSYMDILDMNNVLYLNDSNELSTKDNRVCFRFTNTNNIMFSPISPPLQNAYILKVLKINI